MIKLNEEQVNNEWVKLYKIFEELGLTDKYDMDQLKEELSVSPCALSEDTGVAYQGALLVHINLSTALAQRIAKMISGTFEIDEKTLLKVCVLMHLSKRHLFVENDNQWEVEKRHIYFKFNDNLEGALKFGERSVLEALTRGVIINPIEFEAFNCMDSDDDGKKKYTKSILSMVIRQANELAYAIEKEKMVKK